MRGIQGVVACAVVALALGSTSPLLADQPPPPNECTTDSDCSSCSVCEGARCVMRSGSVCMCHDECVQAGYAACEPMRAESPLCGGTCSAAPPSNTNACGTAHDAIDVQNVTPAWRAATAPIDIVERHGSAPGGLLPFRQRAPHSPLEPRGPSGPTSSGGAIPVGIALLLAASLGVAVRRRSTPKYASLALLWLSAATALASCAGDTSSDAENSGSAGSNANLDEVTEPPILAPESLPESSSPLHLDCDHWELHQPLLRLDRPRAITLAGRADGWLLAFTSNKGTTFVQPIDRFGLPSGTAHALADLEVNHLALGDDGTVGLVTRSGAAYVPEGRRLVLLRIAPDLASVLHAKLLTGPNELISAWTARVQDGALLLEEMIARAVPAIRSLHVMADGSVDQALLMPEALLDSGHAGIIPWEGRLGWLVEQASELRLQVRHGITRELLDDFVFPSLPSGFPGYWSVVTGDEHTPWALLRSAGEETDVLLDLDAAFDHELRLEQLDWPKGNPEGVTAVPGRLLVTGSQNGVGDPALPRIQVLDSDDLSLVQDLAPLVPGMLPDDYVGVSAIARGAHGIGLVIATWTGSSGTGWYFVRLGCSQ